MEIFHSIIVARLIFGFGIINLLAVVTLFFSCRCIPGIPVIDRLMKYRAYQRFFRYHCYLWWVLLPSVVVHATLAVLFFGIPI